MLFHRCSLAEEPRARLILTKLHNPNWGPQLEWRTQADNFRTFLTDLVTAVALGPATDFLDEIVVELPLTTCLRLREHVK
jgi:hypothetical protein